MTTVVATGDMPVEDFWFRRDELPAADLNLVYSILGYQRADPHRQLVLFYVGSTHNLRNRISSHKRWMAALHREYCLTVHWAVTATRREAYRLEADIQMRNYGEAGCQKQLERYGVWHLFGQR